MGKSFMERTVETGDISFIRQGIQYYSDRFLEIVNKAENMDDGPILAAALNTVMFFTESKLPESGKSLAEELKKAALECSVLISVKKEQ